MLVISGVAMAHDPAAPSLTAAPSGPVFHAHGAHHEVDPFQWRSAPPVLYGDEPGEVALTMDLPEGFQLYRDALKVDVVNADSLQVGPMQLPAGRLARVVDTDRSTRAVFDHQVELRMSVRAHEGTPAGLAVLQLAIEHQGCFEGRCLAPEQRVVQVYIPVREPGESPPSCPLHDDE